jgi:hypothetical protein
MVLITSDLTKNYYLVEYDSSGKGVARFHKYGDAKSFALQYSLKTKKMVWVFLYMKKGDKKYMQLKGHYHIGNWYPGDNSELNRRY